MNTEVALQLLKLQLGISTTVRDKILSAKLESVISELEKVQGIKIDIERPDHLDFIVDYTAYRYRGGLAEGLPRHLQWRLHNLSIGGDK